MQLTDKSYVYKDTVVQTLLNDLKDPIFISIYETSSEYALTGFEHFYACLKMNTNDEDQARVLAKRFVSKLEEVQKQASTNHFEFFKPPQSPDTPRKTIIQKRQREDAAFAEEAGEKKAKALGSA